VPCERDAAWVVVETPLAPEALAAFCREVEMLYRINPHLEFESWQLAAGGELRAAAFNHSNDRPAAINGRLIVESDRAWRIAFSSGAKRCTRFEVAALERGSQLTITDEYRTEGPPVVPEAVDRSLHAWGVAIREHLERDRRWGSLPMYRLLVRKLWLPMKPSARRITLLIAVIALADIALLALGFAIYWLETRH